MIFTLLRRFSLGFMIVNTQQERNEGMRFDDLLPHLDLSVQLLFILYFSFGVPLLFFQTALFLIGFFSYYQGVFLADKRRCFSLSKQGSVNIKKDFKNTPVAWYEPLVSDDSYHKRIVAMLDEKDSNSLLDFLQNPLEPQKQLALAKNRVYWLVKVLIFYAFYNFGFALLPVLSIENLEILFIPLFFNAFFNNFPNFFNFFLIFSLVLDKSLSFGFLNRMLPLLCTEQNSCAEKHKTSAFKFSTVFDVVLKIISYLFRSLYICLFSFLDFICSVFHKLWLYKISYPVIASLSFWLMLTYAGCILSELMTVSVIKTAFFSGYLFVCFLYYDRLLSPHISDRFSKLLFVFAQGQKFLFLLTIKNIFTVYYWFQVVELGITLLSIIKKPILAFAERYSDFILGHGVSVLNGTEAYLNRHSFGHLSGVFVFLRKVYLDDLYFCFVVADKKQHSLHDDVQTQDVTPIATIDLKSYMYDFLNLRKISSFRTNNQSLDSSSGWFFNPLVCNDRIQKKHAELLSSEDLYAHVQCLLQDHHECLKTIDACFSNTQMVQSTIGASKDFFLTFPHILSSLWLLHYDADRHLKLTNAFIKALEAIGPFHGKDHLLSSLKNDLSLEHERKQFASHLNDQLSNAMNRHQMNVDVVEVLNTLSIRFVGLSGHCKKMSSTESQAFLIEQFYNFVQHAFHCPLGVIEPAQHILFALNDHAICDVDEHRNAHNIIPWSFLNHIRSLQQLDVSYYYNKDSMASWDHFRSLEPRSLTGIYAHMLALPSLADALKHKISNTFHHADDQHAYALFESAFAPCAGFPSDHIHQEATDLHFRSNGAGQSESFFSTSAFSWLWYKRSLEEVMLYKALDNRHDSPHNISEGLIDNRFLVSNGSSPCDLFLWYIKQEHLFLPEHRIDLSLSPTELKERLFQHVNRYHDVKNSLLLDLAIFDYLNIEAMYAFNVINACDIYLKGRDYLAGSLESDETSVIDEYLKNLLWDLFTNPNGEDLSAWEDLKKPDFSKQYADHVTQSSGFKKRWLVMLRWIDRSFSGTYAAYHDVYNHCVLPMIMEALHASGCIIKRDARDPAMICKYRDPADNARFQNQIDQVYSTPKRSIEDSYLLYTLCFLINAICSFVMCIVHMINPFNAKRSQRRSRRSFTSYPFTNLRNSLQGCLSFFIAALDHLIRITMGAGVVFRELIVSLLIVLKVFTLTLCPLFFDQCKAWIKLMFWMAYETCLDLGYACSLFGKKYLGTDLSEHKLLFVRLSIFSGDVFGSAVAANVSESGDVLLDTHAYPASKKP